MTHYILLAALAGFLIPLQSLINARLGSLLTGPLSAALANFAVGLVAISLLLVGLRYPMPSVMQVATTPWWAWVGGVLGAYFIFAIASSVPFLGAAGTFSIVIATQLVAAMLFDHFGVLHTAQPVAATRLIGAAFLLCGVYLILRPQTS